MCVFFFAIAWSRKMKKKKKQTRTVPSPLRRDINRDNRNLSHPARNDELLCGHRRAYFSQLRQTPGDLFYLFYSLWQGNILPAERGVEIVSETSEKLIRRKGEGGLI